MIDDFPTFFRPGGYHWIDFELDYVYSSKQTLNHLKNLLESKTMAMIIGDAGTGKTTLAQALGHNLLSEDLSHVYYENLAQGSPRSHSSILESLSEIDDALADNDEIDDNWSLFILDNVHLNPSLVRFLYENRWEYENHVRILFVARRLQDTIKEERERWKTLCGESDNSDDMGFYLLDEKKIQTNTKIIIEKYLKHEGFSREKRTKVSKILIEDTSFNLPIISIILKKLVRNLSEQKESDILDYINELNICNEIFLYYDSILTRITQAWAYLEYNAPKINSKEVFNKIIFLLSTFNSMDIPVPDEYLVETIDMNNTEASMKLVKDILRALVDIGEVVENYGLVTLPHQSLAETILKCNIELDNVRNIESSILELAKFIVDNNNTTLFPRLARFVVSNDYKWDDFNEYLTKEGSRFVAIALEIEPEPVIELLTKSGIASDKNIQKAISEVIRNSNEAWRIIESISEIDELAKSQIIITVISETIRDSDFVLRDVLAVVNNKQWKENPRIIEAITGATERIAKSIEDHAKPWWIIEGVKGVPEFLDEPAIKKAIARAISSSDEPWQIIETIRYQPKLLNDPLIKASIRQSLKKSKYPSRILKELYTLSKFIDSDNSSDTHQFKSERNGGR